MRTERTTRKRVPDTPATGASQRDARPAEATPAPCTKGERKPEKLYVSNNHLRGGRGGDVGSAFGRRGRSRAAFGACAAACSRALDAGPATFIVRGRRTRGQTHLLRPRRHLPACSHGRMRALRLFVQCVRVNRLERRWSRHARTVQM